MTVRRQTALQWASLLGLAVEALALVSLAGTLEVAMSVFAFVAAAFAVSLLFRRPASERWLVAGFLVLFAVTIVFWRLMKVHPLLAVAHTAPVAHSLLWFAGRNNRYRGWRLGMGMIELVLASVLTTEAYLPLAIIVFAVLGSVALACNFLDHELRMRAPEQCDNPLPPAFIPRTIGMSLMIFMTAIVIFPILPRTQATFQPLGSSGLRMGYNEGVNVSQWRTFTSSSTGNTVLRLFPSGGGDLTTEIYLGLLRGRVLDAFDGKNWTPAPKRFLDERSPAQGGLPDARGGDSLQVDVIRESIHSDVLPVPYGTRVLRGGKKLRSGEWIDPASWESRVEYSFTLVPNDLTYLREQRSLDQALPIHLTVPRELDNERMRKLARSIFGNAKNVPEKVLKLGEFFHHEHFTAVAGPVEDEGRMAPQSSLTPLEQFIFVRKRGHCEWFSSASAVLLRLAGVPTRLIAGFRVSHGQLTGVLSVHDADAHAWLEVYHPDRGWLPLDPTPRVMEGGSVMDVLRDSYDLASAYWFKYVVSYSSFNFSKIKDRLMGAADDTPDGADKDWGSAALTSLRSNKRIFYGTVLALLAAFGIAALVVRIWFPWVFSIRWRVHEGPAILRRERVRMEKWLKLKPGALGLAAERRKAELAIYREQGTRAGQVFGEWLKTYDDARFGKPEEQAISSQQVQKLRASFRSLTRIAAALLLAWACATDARAATLEGNEFTVTSAPAWLKASRVEQVVHRIGRKLEWDLRRIQVRFHPDAAEFQSGHGFSSPTMTVKAYTRPDDQSVHLGPMIDTGNFDRLFGHELVHVMLMQKYRGSVPKWLEEGLANSLAESKPAIDYGWLRAQPERDVRTLVHPFRGASGNIDAKYHYVASTALIQMISSKCNLTDLLQLSVGKSLESYLPTYCGISDINADFRHWLKARKQ